MTQTHQQHRPPLLNRRETYTAVTDATYTAKAGDQVIGVNRAGAVTVTLLTAEVRPGRIYTVKDESGAASSNNITVATEGAETIDGSATHVLGTNYQAVTYYSDGSNWFIVPIVAAGGAGGATERVGGNTTEATTTSTSEVELLAVASLTVPALTPIFMLAAARKSSGAADNVNIRFRLNTTNIATLSSFSATDQAESGMVSAWVSPRLTNYVRGAQVFRALGQATTVGNFYTPGDDLPTVQITDISIRGNSQSPSITLGVDEFHIYTLATS